MALTASHASRDKPSVSKAAKIPERRRSKRFISCMFYTFVARLQRNHAVRNGSLSPAAQTPMIPQITSTLVNDSPAGHKSSALSPVCERSSCTAGRRQLSVQVDPAG